MAKISWDVRGGIVPDFSTPEPEIVEQTYERHPVPQCRLDTYYQGALKTVSAPN